MRCGQVSPGLAPKLFTYSHAGAQTYERIRKMNQAIPIRKSSPEPT